VKKLTLLLVFLVALVSLAGACGPATSYAATVNGVRLSQQDLNDELEAIRDNKSYAQAVEQQLSQGGEKLRGSGKNTFDAAFVARVLTRQIFLSIVHQGVTDKKLVVKQSDLSESRKQQEQQFEQQFGDKKVWAAFPKTYQDTLVRRAAEVKVLQEGLSKNKVDDKTVKEYYEAHKAEFSETCARHILASFPGDRRSDTSPPPPDVDAATKAKAQGWKDRIDKGEDFAAIAKAESGDPGSGANGGDLGCQGGFVKEFTDAMAALQPGQTSGPVLTQFGYHIIQVTSRKDKTLEEATPAIKQTLQGQSQGEVQTFLEQQINKARIKVNPRYGTFDKGDAQAGKQPQVIPPKGPSTTTTSGPVPGAGAGGAVPGGGAPSGGSGPSDTAPSDTAPSDTAPSGTTPSSTP
jgi:parvulin-like peptidyl-prolyl isomerase